MLALVVDVGSFYTTKAWLQAIADTAVLTGAASLDASQSFDSQQAHARAVITRTAQANGLDPVMFTVTVEEGEDNRLLTVTVEAAHAMPTLFAAAVGLDRVTIGVHATAEVPPRPVPLVRPAHLTE
jgi:Flp pilus assembly protein TadG